MQSSRVIPAEQDMRKTWNNTKSTLKVQENSNLKHCCILAIASDEGPRSLGVGIETLNIRTVFFEIKVCWRHLRDFHAPQSLRCVKMRECSCSSKRRNNQSSQIVNRRIFLMLEIPLGKEALRRSVPWWFGFNLLSSLIHPWVRTFGFPEGSCPFTENLLDLLKIY